MPIDDFATIDDVIKDVSQGGDIYTGGSLSEDIPTPQIEGVNKGASMTTYDIPIESVYTKLRDGSYTPMFKNYKGAFDNEDRLAKEQGFFEKMGYGIGRLGSKAGMYALDAVVGTAIGISDAIGSGEWSDIWDNDFSNWVDDVNTKLDYALPVYKDNDYKSQNILENIFYSPLTFMTGDLADGLAFVAGAALPEAALAIASGGATLPTSFAKVGAKLGLKTMSKKVAKDQALKMSRTFMGAKIGDVTGNILKTGGFLVRTSNFEASVEARHNFHESVDSYINTFHEENGEMPDMDSLQDFMKGATSAANGVHLANLAILSVSNTAMFGKTFGILNKQRGAVNDFGNRLIGLKPKIVKGKAVLPKATKGQKIAGNAYKILSKPMIEGLYEEGLQGVAGETMQHYLESTYSPEYEPGYDIWSSLYDGFAQTYGTKEGWKEIGLGMIIGSLGGKMSSMLPGTSSQSIPGFGKDSYGAQRSKLQKMVDGQNQSYERLGEVITNNLNHANSARAYRESLEKNPDSPMSDVNATMLAMEFIKTQEHLKTPNQILQDYTNFVQAAELDEQAVEELGGTQEAITNYKNQMIEGFRETADAYGKADRFVNRLGINEKTPLNLGNNMALQDYVKTSIVLGETSKTRMQRVGTDIDAIIGQDGSYNAMKFYSQLDQENKERVLKLREDRSKLADLKEKFQSYTMRLSGVQPSPGLSDQKLEQRRNKTAEQRTLLGEQVVELENEIEKVEAILEENYRATDADLATEELSEGIFETVKGNLEKLDRISKYSEIMKEGGLEQESEVLDGLVGQFKDMSDMVRESDNLVRRMADSNFLTSNRGQGLLGSILGTSYKMSPEFRQQLRDNDEIIDRQLQKTGVRGYQTVEGHLEQVLEKNPNLSEREKFRMETIIRLQLNVGNVIEKFNEQAEQKEEVTAEKEGGTSRMEGDTITLRRRVDMSEKGKTSVQQLDEMIGEMIAAVEEIREGALQRRKANDPEIQQQIADKQDQIQKLREEIKAIESGQTVSQVNKEKLSLEERKERLTTKAKENYEEATENYPDRSQEDVETLNKIVGDLKNTPQDKARKVALELLVDEIEYETKLEDELDTQTLDKKAKEKVKNLENKVKILEEEEKEILKPEVPRIMESEDYRRINELNTKRHAGQELTAKEMEELTELEQEMDAWLEATGAVAQGYRLSDLIRLRSQLADTGIRQVETLEEVTPLQKRIAGDFKDKGSSPHYDFAQNYGAVTATTVDKGKKVVISGMTYAELQELAEMDFEQVEDEYENKRGNTVITVETKDSINQNSKLKILPPGENNLTSYTTVRLENEQGVLEPIMSNYGRDFNGEGMNTEILYDVQETKLDEKGEVVTKGDIVTLSVDPMDPYNQDLIQAYRDAETKKERKEALEELKEGLVIRTGVRATFSGVLKSKRKGTESQKDKQFEAMRNQLINDENFLRQITEEGAIAREIPIEGKARAKKLWLGLPNQVMKLNEEGQVVVEEQRFSEKDTEKVVDIGYVQGGKMMTRSKNKGINTTFMSGVLNKENLKGRTPFVVIQKGKQRIAYPVTLRTQEEADTTPFTTIFNSNASTESKVFKLNELLAGFGVDIKQQGNYFDFQNISNQEFFNQKLAQVENMEYFYDLGNWITKQSSIKDILMEQATIDLDMSNPIHSPKLQLDYSDLKVDLTNLEGETRKSKPKVSKPTKDKIEKKKNEDCPKGKK